MRQAFYYHLRLSNASDAPSCSAVYILANKPIIIYTHMNVLIILHVCISLSTEPAMLFTKAISVDTHTNTTLGVQKCTPSVGVHLWLTNRGVGSRGVDLS